MTLDDKTAIKKCLIDAKRIQARVVALRFASSARALDERLDIYALNRMTQAIGDFQGDAKLLLRDGEPQDYS